MPTVMPIGPIPPPVDNDDMLLVVCWFCWPPPDIVKLGMDVMGLERIDPKCTFIEIIIREWSTFQRLEKI